MQSADFLSAVFFYLKVGENLNQNWIVENLNNAFSTGRAVLCYIAMQKHNEFSRVKTPRSCNPLLSPLCGGKSACGIRHGHYAECVFDL